MGTTVGHWDKFANSEGRPVVDRVCAEDVSTEIPGSQLSIYLAIKLYYQNYLSIPVGAVLLIWCLYVYFLSIWGEVQAAFDRIISVSDLPTVNQNNVDGTVILPSHDSEGFILLQITVFRKCLVIALCVLRI